VLIGFSLIVEGFGVYVPKGPPPVRLNAGRRRIT
jgi:hypothetical protein